MKKTNTPPRFAVLLLAVVLAMTSLSPATPAYAVPLSNSTQQFDSYNYDHWGYIHFTPAPYTLYDVISTKNMTYDGKEIGELSAPQDICKDPDGNVYIVDSKNDRIVVLNNDLSGVVKIITEFDNNGKKDKLRTPYGCCVSDEGHVYIADYKNKRIVVLDGEGNLLQIVEKPQAKVLGENYVFEPQKVAVDYAGRIYCIVRGAFQGILVFDTDGNFSTFFGTINVRISAWDIFWKRFSNKAQRENQKLFIPTEFTGLDIDEDGFVYATNIDSAGEQGVRRLNPAGVDVIKKGRNENVGGDLNVDGTSQYAGASQFADVVYRGNGIYSCLDRKRGRIFTYDHEGNLLYIFGGMGYTRGTFTTPVSIEDIGGRLVVVDANKNQIIVFEETEYGRLINEAVSLRYGGDESEAVDIWKEVLLLDEDNELANDGIGKAYLTSGDYVNAMKYLKLGQDKDNYSIAYKRYRNQFLVKYIGYFMTIAIVVIAFFVGKKYYKKRKGRDTDE